ncbi:MAG: DUF5615 family PIN-like protein [Lewinellaceae bacterium]|nr:DUF5615 family PIN-like protein [Lewinella sp.]MCB9282119.1 DUF5615 family PIN-like protein [Lewinellaceae bacterium]
MLRFKLDENFSPSLTLKFKKRGFDAESVLDEKLSGSPDEDIFNICKLENRCLITLDLDFSNIIRFPADQTNGIIVVRPNRPANFEVMQTMTNLLLDQLSKNDPKGCLWILEPHQLRIRKPETE